jgi:hypothetical protein
MMNDELEDLTRRHKHALHKIDVLEDKIEKLYKALDIYKRERDRFKHTHPEITGAYFLTGGHGETDDNMMPQFVEICPAYGVGWTKVYEDTGRVIMYEGS